MCKQLRLLWIYRSENFMGDQHNLKKKKEKHVYDQLFWIFESKYILL